MKSRHGFTTRSMIEQKKEKSEGRIFHIMTAISGFHAFMIRAGRGDIGTDRRGRVEEVLLRGNPEGELPPRPTSTEELRNQRRKGTYLAFVPAWAFPLWGPSAMTVRETQRSLEEGLFYGGGDLFRGILCLIIGKGQRMYWNQGTFKETPLQGKESSTLRGDHLLC